MSKIGSVRAESLDLPLREPFRIALGTQYNTPNVIIFVETEADVVGPDEGSSGHYVTDETRSATFDTVSKTSELLAGRDVTNYRAIIEDLHTTFPSAVSSLFALETAIINAYCREIGISMAELPGGSPDAVETNMTILIHTPDVAVEKAESVVQNGFGMLKIKVGEDLETDIQRVRSVSEAVPNMTIAVGANQR